MTGQINPYLHLGGKCREAMTFYKECLGGELGMHEVAESPMADRFPESQQNQILHASLTHGSLTLLASDLMDGQGAEIGNTFSLSLNCVPEEIHRYYSLISAEGIATRPIHEFFAGLIGAATDKFGISWMFYAEKNN